MGFLTEGDTFVWEETLERPVDLVKRNGLLQFLAIYNRLKDRSRDSLRWGDEIEYILVHLDQEKQQAQLLLRAPELLKVLCKEEEDHQNSKDHVFEMLWRPEYARYMVEGTPGQPFGSGGIADVVHIERSMQRRREHLFSALGKDEQVVSLANFPLLGAVQSGQYTYPETSTQGPVAQSLFTSDELIFTHRRFPTLTANIRRRRGRKVEILVPLFKDINTTSSPLPIPSSDAAPPKGALQPYTIYMDSMAFGMGCCCLQATLQCCNIEEARYFYDQLAVLSPIMLALTAATPIFRGYLADVDARWNIISASVDDRTEEELGLKPLNHNEYLINKSRYDSIDCFISNDPRMKAEKYNDINLIYSKEAYTKLREGGVDHLLARHIAHLFIRDPLVIYRDKLLLDNEKYSDHFENIQSTNWQTVRFKPPPPNSPIGWRVEFRPMEIQLSDFENAAFVVFTILMTRLLTAFDLNLYIPLSKVDANMVSSQKRGAAINEKFYFRKDLTNGHISEGEEYELMTIDEIMNGKKSTGNFPGLISMMHVYLDTINLSKEDRSKVNRYLAFVGDKASGKLPTTATWIRNFVQNHKDYKQDSVISQQINHDLVALCVKIGRGEEHPELLLGKYVS